MNFCRNLNWQSVACVLESYSGRLSFGVRPELVPLSRLGPEVITLHDSSRLSYSSYIVEDVVCSCEISFDPSHVCCVVFCYVVCPMVSFVKMPGFRARAFYQSGITSPEEILYASPDLICSILVGMP